MSKFLQFKCGDEAEALDEYQVWTTCFIKERSDDGVKVSFKGWSAKWDRYIHNEQEIREVSIKHGKRSLQKITYKNPQITKIVADDSVWLGEQEIRVKQVDPINGNLLVQLHEDDVWLPVSEFTTNPPVSDSPINKKTKKKSNEQPGKLCDRQSTQDSTDQPSSREGEESSNDVELDFSVFVREDGLLFKVGSLCFVDTCTCPVLLSRIFKHNGKVLVSGLRCQCDGVKVVSLLHDFVLTVECSYVVRLCPSSEYCMSRVSGQVASVLFQCQTRICRCQEKNFGNVSYQRELRRHALGVQIRQAVSSGISLNATRPAQPISLGVFEPFHDMAIFGLSEGNKFKVSFSILGGFEFLDFLNGKGWDVKPLRSDVSDSHFKFVRTATIYLDKKNFLLKFSFSYSEAPFCLSTDYRVKCCALLNNI